MNRDPRPLLANADGYAYQVESRFRLAQDLGCGRPWRGGTSRTTDTHTRASGVAGGSGRRQVGLVSWPCYQ